MRRLPRSSNLKCLTGSKCGLARCTCIGAATAACKNMDAIVPVFPPYFRPGSRRSTGLEVDHQVYSDREGIWNCGCAFRMDEILKTGLNDQPWSDRAPVCPLDGGFEISHSYGQARGIAGLFRLAETRGVRAVR